MSADGRVTIWMRLRNAREVAAGLRRTAIETGFLASSVDRLAKHMERAGRRTFIMNQLLFTLRRYSYMATLAITAGAVAIAKWGFDYNSQVQIATVAFHQFGLTAKQASAEVSFLFNKIAAPSPFQLKDLTLGARRLMAFGLNVQETNATLLGITNALTAFGITSGAALSRATLALGHMLLVGRVTGQALFQLNRDNIPLTAALTAELGLTGDQLRNVSKLGIPAGVAIKALNKYLSETPRFHNAAKVFSMKTWAGIISTTKDYMAQFVGVIEKPLFDRAQDKAKDFLRWLTSGKVQMYAKKGDIAGVIGTFSPGMAQGWKVLTLYMRSAWRVLNDGIIPAFMTVARYLGPVILFFLLAWGKGFEFLSHHTFIAKLFFGLLAAEVGLLLARYALLLPVQTLLMARMIIYNSLQKIGIILGLIRVKQIEEEVVAVKTQEIAYTRLGKILKLDILLTKLQTFWNKRLLVSFKLLMFGYVAQGGKASYVSKTLEGRALRLRIAFRGLITSLKMYVLGLRMAAAATYTFLATNPIGWAIIAISIFAILYWRWERFRNAVNALAKFLWNHPLVAFFVPIIGPLIVMVKLLTHALDLVHKLWNIVRHPLGGGRGSFFGNLAKGFVKHVIPGGNLIPGLAGGGSIASPGWSLVGENGPEMQYMPRGASVVPLGQKGGMSPWDPDTLTFYIENHTTVELDGAKVAKSVSKHRIDGRARR